MKHILSLVSLLVLSTLFTSAQCTLNLKKDMQVYHTVYCDSAIVNFTNKTDVTLSEIDSFTWNFGDGNTIRGNTSTNTQWWTGMANDGKMKYTYTKSGDFNVQLNLYLKNSCAYLFEYKFSWVDKDNIHITNSKEKSVFSISENPIQFTTIPKIPTGSIFTWNFGDPPSGPINTDTKTITPSHSYPLGAYLVTLRLRYASCDFIITDTLQIVGPIAQIEIPYKRIAHKEKFQCVVTDTVHFTNNSAAYHADNNINDEDSVLVIGGKSYLAFDYNLATKSGSQESLSSAAHKANRTLGAQITHFWDFGDKYASQCTTTTAANLNVGKNCNYSRDKFPLHKYQDWDSIYYHNFYKSNVVLSNVVYNQSTTSCVVQAIDTTNPVLHKSLFYKKYKREYKATLTLTDTISGFYDIDSVKLHFGKPDATKLKLVGGVPCPLDGNNLQYYLNFEMNAGGHSYFAVNYDSLANPTKFYAFNSGGILAPPAQGSPFPFILPYDLVGDVGTQFVKGYNTYEVGNDPSFRKNGSFTLGLITGNGPLSSITGLPQCLDTAWHHDLFRIDPPNADFDMLNEPYLCAGGDAYFKLKNETQRKTKFIRWTWGYQDRTVGYFEEFNYGEKYIGPSSNRNDKNVTYKGENWLYNYAVRSTIDDVRGVQTIDTLVTRILKKWETCLSDFDLGNLLFAQIGLDMDAIPKNQRVKFLGNGSIGCVDTTGYGQLFEKQIYIKEFRENDDPMVFSSGDKRYRYTDASKTSSYEVAQVLHFRDSSLRGFDTLIKGTDTTFGVWKHSYMYETIENGDTVLKKANTLLVPNLYISNVTGCGSRGSTLLNVGYIKDFKILPTGLQAGKEMFLKDSIRYYQFGDIDYMNYPIDTNNYWNRIDRRMNGIEDYKILWDTAKSSAGWQTGFNLKNTYANYGNYVAAVYTKDSIGCKDTTYVPVKVSGLNVDFSFAVKDTLACSQRFKFTDLSNIVPSNSDSIVSWAWTFGDSKSSTDQNPEHYYAAAGSYNVKLEAKTTKGITVSATKQVNSAAIALPTNDFNYSVNNLNVTVNKLSPKTNHMYAWDFDDNYKDTSNTSSHTYSSGANYSVCLKAINTSNGCVSSACKTINVGGCNAYFTYVKDSTSTFAIAVLDSSSGTNLSYKWYWGDGDSSITQYPSHAYKTFGKYLVTLKVSNTNCQSTYSDSLGMDAKGNLLKKDGFVITVKDPTAALNDITLKNISVYPNPSKGEINVSLETANINSLQLFTIDGKQMDCKIEQLSEQHWKLMLDVAAGNYLLRINTAAGVATRMIEIRN